MRRTRRPRRRLPLPLLPLQSALACDGGDAAPAARPHELRLAIAYGKGMRDAARLAPLPGIPGAPRAADEQAGLDRFGNRNGRHDVGDLRAYIRNRPRTVRQRP